MKKSSRILNYPVEAFVSLLVLSFLLVYTYAYFYLIPNVGFDFDENNQIIKVPENQASENELRLGDRIVEIEGYSLDEFAGTLSISRIASYRAGDTIKMVVIRDEQPVEVQWQLQALDRTTFNQRLGESVWLVVPYSFWIAGALAFFVVRPRNLQRNLLAAFNFNIALWVITGYISSWNVLYSWAVFHLLIWLNLPLSWHLNWIFPRPTRILSTGFWIAIYVAAMIGAGIDLFSQLEGRLFLIPMGFSAIGSLLILGSHLIFQPENRRLVIILMVGFTAAVLPALFYFLTPLLQFSNAYTIYWFSLAALVLIPISYFFVIFYRRLGGLEVRTSSAIAMIFYGIFVFLGNYLALYIFVARLQTFYLPVSSLIAISIFNCIFTIWLYPPFKRMIEHRLLGIPIPPQSLLASYTSQIITATNLDQLKSLLKDQIFPSLLIRQVLLLKTTPSHQVEQSDYQVIFSMQVEEGQLPSASEIPRWIAHSGRLLLPAEQTGEPNELTAAWVRLVINKTFEPDLQVLCCFGKRDPDDYYAANEIQILQALVDNLALALVNIEQSTLLHHFYQANIQRYEQERLRLALELHDDVLGQMALLVHAVDENDVQEDIIQTYQASTQRVREIISGLRPPMLNFGLAAALSGLEDEVRSLAGEQVNIELSIDTGEDRYPPDVELHLFRIVQQASFNAVRHSQAEKITVTGILRADWVLLTVEDNGIGLSKSGSLDLAWLVSHQQYGLAGIFERAALINANLQLRSTPGKGTQIQVSWHATNAPSAQNAEIRSTPVVQPAH
jgi:signal transduction histidine kinase